MNQFLTFAVSLTWVDYVILIIIGLSILRGVRRGFVKEALSLITWIAALVVSIKFYLPVSLYLSKWISTHSVQKTLAFIAIFLVILILGNILNALFSKLIKITGLSIPNRIIGIFFGAVRGILIVVLFVILAKFTALPEDAWWKKSVLIPQAEKIADMISF